MPRKKQKDGERQNKVCQTEPGDSLIQINETFKSEEKVIK